MSSEPPRETRLRALLERHFEVLEEGGDVDLEELCRDDPALLPRLRELLERDADLLGCMRPDAGPPLQRSGRLGDFELVRRLGRGGMGDVWLARQSSLGREVALKILRDGDDETARVRFLREAQIAAALDHPHIVPVFAVGEDAGRAWIAMKLVDGPSLAEIERPLPARDVAEIGVAIANALHEAHLSGVVHRDVKPGNVMLDRDVPVLLDFGLAREYGATRMTSEGTVPGTFLYMSPEQAAGRALDPRTDVYSLCATLYESVSGRSLLEPSTPDVLLRAIAVEEPRRLDLPAADRDLATIIERGLAKELDLRYMSAAELAADLTRFLSGEPIAARPSSTMRKVYRFLRRRPAVAIPTAVIAAVAVAVVAWVIIGARREADANREQLARIMGAVDDGRLRAGADLLASLEDRAPAALGIEAARARLDAAAALVDLTEEVVSLPVADCAPVLRRARDRVRARASDGDPLTWVSLALAANRLGEPDELRRTVEHLEREFGTSRTIAALRRLADDAGVIDSADLPPAQPLGKRFATVDDEVFAALTIRASGGTLSDQRAAMSRALSIAPEAYFVRYALAILRHEEGRFRVAEALLLGLLSEGRYRPVVLRNLALEALALNEPDEAQRRLDAIGPEDRDVAWLLLDIEVARGRETPEEVIGRIERALERAPDLEPLLLLKKAQALFETSAKSKALAVIERALDSVVEPALRHAMETWRLGVLVEDELADPDRDRDDVLDLIEEARDLAEAAPDRLGRADALVLISRLEESLGRREEAVAALDASLGLAPENPGAALLFTSRVAQQALGVMKGTALAMPSADDVARARRLVAAVLEGTEGSRRPATARQLAQALQYAAFLTLADEDAPALAAAVGLYRRGGRTIPADVDDVIGRVSSWLDGER